MEVREFRGQGLNVAEVDLGFYRTGLGPKTYRVGVRVGRTRKVLSTFAYGTRIPLLVPGVPFFWSGCVQLLPLLLSFVVMTAAATLVIEGRQEVALKYLPMDFDPAP